MSYINSFTPQAASDGSVEALPEQDMFPRLSINRANLLAQDLLTVGWGPLKRKPIDFKYLEQLRKRMLLSVTNLVQLLGVSRVTYYNWLKGIQPRGVRAAKVRDVMRKLMSCVDYCNWPTSEALVANQKQRMNLLLDCFKKLDNQLNSAIV